VALGEELLAEERGAVQGGEHAPVGQEPPVPVRLLPLLRQQPRRRLLSYHTILCSAAPVQDNFASQLHECNDAKCMIVALSSSKV